MNRQRAKTEVKDYQTLELPPILSKGGLLQYYSPSSKEITISIKYDADQSYLSNHGRAGYISNSIFLGDIKTKNIAHDIAQQVSKTHRRHNNSFNPQSLLRGSPDFSTHKLADVKSFVQIYTNFNTNRS